MRWTPLPAPFDLGEAAHCPSRPCHQSRSARRRRAPKCRPPLGSKARIVRPPRLDRQWRPVGPLEARFHAAVLEREPDREVLFLADEICRLAQLAGVRRFAYPNRLVRARDHPQRNFDEAGPRRLCDQRVGERVRLESSLWDARLEPHALAYALIAQTARTCFVKVPLRVVASTYKAIGIGEPPDARELREATDFIREKEDLTIRLTLEYGRMKPRLKRSDRPPLPV